MIEKETMLDSGNTEEDSIAEKVGSATEDTASSEREETETNTEKNVEPSGEEAKKNDSDEKINKDVAAKMIGRCFETPSTSGRTVISTSKVQKTDVDIHYYIELLDNGSIALELVDENGEPSGNLLEDISKEYFAKRFKTCSQHECPLQISTLDEIEKKMAENRSKMGEDHLKKGELDKAKDKFKRALKFDEKSITAKFGLGKTYLEKGETDSATEIFEELSKTEALFDKENKHIFNKFGIELRRSEMYDLSIANYEKAILIDPKDEALYYNLSVAYEKKELVSKAIEKLKEALNIDNNFPEAKKRLELLIAKEKETLDGFLEKK